MSIRDRQEVEKEEHVTLNCTFWDHYAFHHIFSLLCMYILYVFFFFSQLYSLLFLLSLDVLNKEIYCIFSAPKCGTLHSSIWQQMGKNTRATKLTALKIYDVSSRSSRVRYENTILYRLKNEYYDITPLFEVSDL